MLELPRFGKKLQKVKTILEQWIFLIKHLHELKNIPKKLENEIFNIVYEMAKIAKMSKKEVRIYLKSLNDMSMVEYEIKRRDRAIAARDRTIAAVRTERDAAWNTITQQGNTITQQGNTITQQGNTIAGLQSNNAALQNQLEEYQRRYGNLNGASTLN